MAKTYSTRPSDNKETWHTIDADGVVLGRLATTIAKLLRGKHKPIFSPSVDAGDHVIVINAAKVAVTPRKLTAKKYRRHSGYPGGLKEDTLGVMLQKHPDRVIMAAVQGMLPKNRLGRKQLKKLRVFAGTDHHHEAQQPVPYDLHDIKGVQ